ncbi:MAG: queuosine salvage family protein [Myxococcales bacterium]|nr:queuosine salvage family protein [Myxococcales bacterium]
MRRLAITIAIAAVLAPASASARRHLLTMPPSLRARSRLLRVKGKAPLFKQRFAVQRASTRSRSRADETLRLPGWRSATPKKKREARRAKSLRPIQRRVRAVAAKSENPVLSSVLPVVETSKHVKSNIAAIERYAAKFAASGAKLEIPDWKLPVIIDHTASPADQMQFFLIASAINYKFFHGDADTKYAFTYGGVPWRGSMAMVASLKAAMERGVPVLDAKYLANLSEKQARAIFSGDGAKGIEREMPMLRERVKALNEVGRVLLQKYDGKFINLAKAANYRAYDRGNGMVERLVAEFPSFRDQVRDPRSGKTVRIDKRAQLAIAEMYGRFQATPHFKVPDIGQLTVFADYQVPRTLEHLGLIRYSAALKKKIARGAKIRAGSAEEVEIRAHTIYASALLEQALRARGIEANALNIDYLLWSEGRKIKGVPHHLTETTAY